LQKEKALLAAGLCLLTESGCIFFIFIEGMQPLSAF
jgi:hypothetical protein